MYSHHLLICLGSNMDTALALWNLSLSARWMVPFMYILFLIFSCSTLLNVIIFIYSIAMTPGNLTFDFHLLLYLVSSITSLRQYEIGSMTQLFF